MNTAIELKQSYVCIIFGTFFFYLVLLSQIINVKTANALSLFVSGMQVQTHTVSLSGDHTIKGTHGMDCTLSKIAIYYGDVNNKIAGS